MEPSILMRKSGCQIDISRTAKMLIERHGRYAGLVAARWADCAARAGNQDRAAAWRQIVEAVMWPATIDFRPKPACLAVSTQSCAA